MATIQVRNIPDDVYLTYRSRALAARQSVQEYLLDKLVTDARRPTVRGWMREARANATADVMTTDVLDAIDEGRSGR
jgi:plasmid stability protein